MKRQIVVKASSEPVRKVIKASKSTADMLDAFQDKLEEFGIESSTDVRASEEDDRKVEIYDSDYEEKYIDVGQGFGGEQTDVYSVGEMKEYWNENNIGDPVLAEYPDFDAWFKETRANSLQEA